MIFLRSIRCLRNSGTGTPPQPQFSSSTQNLPAHETGGLPEHHGLHDVLDLVHELGGGAATGGKSRGYEAARRPLTCTTTGLFIVRSLSPSGTGLRRSSSAHRLRRPSRAASFRSSAECWRGR
jgi:hypothetical protein